jgi:Rrf2 family iron-sulfur cluster assembly transcriptional regulator
MALLAEGRQLKAAELAEALDASSGFVPQVVGPLVKAGWVRSDPGPAGGYSLVVSPAEVSVLEIVEAIDGPTDTGRCVVADMPCGLERPCALHGAWAGARDQLVASLGAVTVADVAATATVTTR